MTDWVIERSRCYPANAFETLKAAIKDDVKARNALIASGDSSKFTVSRDDSPRLIVTLEYTIFTEKGPSAISKSVGIELDGKEIIGTNLQRSFRATLTIDENQKCKLKIDGVEYDFWRVRQMLLEDLFFNIV